MKKILQLTDHQLQLIIRQMDNLELAAFTKQAPELVREKIFSNLSERAGKLLRQDMNRLKLQANELNAILRKFQSAIDGLAK